MNFLNLAFCQVYVIFPSAIRCCQIILHDYYCHTNRITRWFEVNKMKCAGGQSVVGVDLGDISVILAHFSHICRT
jgi:hypothetical protein